MSMAVFYAEPKSTMLRRPSLLQAVLLVIVAVVSSVHGLGLQDPSSELHQGHLDAETETEVSIDAEHGASELSESRRGLLGRRYYRRRPTYVPFRPRSVAIANSQANSLALAGRRGVAIANSDARSNALAGRGGLAIAGSQANSVALAGRRGTAVANSRANSNAVAGRGGVAIADSEANSVAVAGRGGTAAANAQANSRAVAGNGGVAIAKSKATATAVAA